MFLFIVQVVKELFQGVDAVLLLDESSRAVDGETPEFPGLDEFPYLVILDMSGYHPGAVGKVLELPGLDAPLLIDQVRLEECNPRDINLVHHITVVLGAPLEELDSHLLDSVSPDFDIVLTPPVVAVDEFVGDDDRTGDFPLLLVDAELHIALFGEFDEVLLDRREIDDADAVPGALIGKVYGKYWYIFRHILPLFFYILFVYLLKEKGMDSEVWRDIPGFEEYYQASNLGRIRSKFRVIYSLDKRVCAYYGRILKLRNIGRGYLGLNLAINGTIVTKSVHRLVWSAFNGPIPEGMQINHINEDKTDNRLENLNLMTPKENTNWGTGIKRRAKSTSNKMKGMHLYEENPKARTIMEYDKNNIPVCFWFSIKAAAEYHGKDYTTIMLNLAGKSKSLQDGTYFKYAKKEAV